MADSIPTGEDGDWKEMDAKDGDDSWVNPGNDIWED